MRKFDYKVLEVSFWQNVVSTSVFDYNWGNTADASSLSIYKLKKELEIALSPLRAGWEK